jgi:hypothetical protein
MITEKQFDTCRAAVPSLPITNYGFQTFSIENISELPKSNGFSLTEVTEKKERHSYFSDQTFENAFIVETARKTR